MSMGSQSKVNSADEFLAWDTTQTIKHEFVRGRVVALSGAHEAHVTLVGNVYSALIDDSALIRLDDAELEAYRSGGHEYLTDLATRIHHSAPYLESSRYFPRDLYRGPEGARYRQVVADAIADHTWIADHRRRGAD